MCWEGRHSSEGRMVICVVVIWYRWRYIIKSDADVWEGKHIYVAVIWLGWRNIVKIDSNNGWLDRKPCALYRSVAYILLGKLSGKSKYSAVPYLVPSLITCLLRQLPYRCGCGNYELTIVQHLTFFVIPSWLWLTSLHTINMLFSHIFDCLPFSVRTALPRWSPREIIELRNSSKPSISELPICIISDSCESRGRGLVMYRNTCRVDSAPEMTLFSKPHKISHGLGAASSAYSWTVQ